MTCLRCQTRVVAGVLGTRDALIDELGRQLDALGSKVIQVEPTEPVISQAEHERIVEALNRTIAARNGELASARKARR